MKSVSRGGLPRRGAFPARMAGRGNCEHRAAGASEGSRGNHGHVGSVRPDWVVARCRRAGRRVSSRRGPLCRCARCGRVGRRGAAAQGADYRSVAADDKGAGRRSHAKIRADRAFDKLKALGFAGSQRTVRRAVAEVEANCRCGRRRVYRRWIPEPGMWAQRVWGAGPVVAGKGDESVLCVAGVIEVPGGGAVLGSQVGDGGRLCGPGDARLRWRADVLVDRQRAHRHDRPRRGGWRSAIWRWSRSAATTGPRRRRVCRRIPSPKAARRRRRGSREPAWCQPTRTRATATPAGLSWSRPARRGWPRSTAASIG